MPRMHRHSLSFVLEAQRLGARITQLQAAEREFRQQPMGSWRQTEWEVSKV